MQISLERVNDKFEFLASNQNGNQVTLDASAKIGGGDKSFRPMEMLLVGLAACSGIDILNILYKQRQEVTSFKIEIEAEREGDKTPSLFENIRVHVKVSGAVKEKKLAKALELTTEKYCSVYFILKETANIQYTYEIEA